MSALDHLTVQVAEPVAGVVNRLGNPSGADGSTRGWSTPVAGTSIKASSTSAGTDDHGVVGAKLIYSATNAADNYFRSQRTPCNAGQWVAARWQVPYVDGAYRVALEWLNSAGAVLGTSDWTWWRTATGDAWSVLGPQQAPANTQFVQLRFYHYVAAGSTGRPATGADLVFRAAQLAVADAKATLGTRRISHVGNGGFEASAAGWNFSTNVSGGSQTYPTDTPHTGSRYARVVHTTGTGDNRVTTTSATGAVPGDQLTVSVWVRATVSRTIRFVVRLNGTGGAADLLSPDLGPAPVGVWTQFTHTFTIPASATGAGTVTGIFSWGFQMVGAALNEVHSFDSAMATLNEPLGAYFDQSVGSAGTHQEPWGGRNGGNADFPAGAGSQQATVVEISDVAVTWLDARGPHSAIRITRVPLDAGTLTTEAKASQLTAQQLPLITKPGTGYRVLVDTDLLIDTKVVAAGPRDGGQASAGTVLKIEAADAAAELVAASRPNGVATLPELSALFEGLDVDYRINGSADQVATTTTVGVNKAAKAIDQIAMTRDQNARAFAWVNRSGVVEIRSAANLDATERAVLTEADYSAFTSGYDVDQLVNSVRVRIRNTSGAVTEYGPYTDTPSIEEWGEHPVTLTLQAVTPSATLAQSVAAVLLASNADVPFQPLTATVPIVHDGTDALLATNLHDNPSLETGTGRYTGANGATLTRQAASAIVGGFGLRVACPANGVTDSGVNFTSSLAVVAGRTYTVSIALRAVTAGTYNLSLQGPGGDAGTRPTVTLAAGQTARLTKTWTPTAAGVLSAYVLRGNGSVAMSFDVDAAMLVEGTTLPAYFDGDTPDTAEHTYQWTGTAHGSPSQKLATKKLDDRHLARLDLYDLVRVRNTAAGIDQTVRVVHVEHEITPRKWLLHLKFAHPGLAALPQVIPDP